MQSITTIGLDIAKSVFQVHGVDVAGQVVVRRQLKRRHVLTFFEKLPPCLVGIEACASSHHWSRQLQALGHSVRLMPPAYVKPYVKRQKNDVADAEAICEAVTRANMRFVPTKTPEQQSVLMLDRTRHLSIRQQTSVINAIRAHLAEFGIVAPVGRRGVEELLTVIADPNDKRVSDVARACLVALGSQLLSLKKQILHFDRMIMVWHRSNATSKRLNYIPGVGPLLATALVSSVADPRAFRSGRNFSAWIGLRVWFASVWRNKSHILKETVKALVKAFALFVDAYEESNGLHQSQDLLQWSKLFAIRDCRQLLPPMSPTIQVSH